MQHVLAKVSEDYKNNLYSGRHMLDSLKELKIELEMVISKHEMLYLYYW